jgi:hypothetical protein
MLVVLGTALLVERDAESITSEVGCSAMKIT